MIQPFNRSFNHSPRSTVRSIRSFDSFNSFVQVVRSTYSFVQLVRPIRAYIRALCVYARERVARGRVLYKSKNGARFLFPIGPVNDRIRTHPKCTHKKIKKNVKKICVLKK